MAIDPNIILAGQQQPNTLNQTANGIQFGQGIRQLLALRQIGNMSSIADDAERKNFANNSMFSRELNAQLKSDNALKQKQIYDQLKTEADIAKTSSEASKNNAQAGGFNLDNSLKGFGAIQGVFQSAAMTGDKGQVLLGLDALKRTGAITPENYSHNFNIIKEMSTDEIKQYASGIGLGNKEVAPYLYQSKNNEADNATSTANNMRTTNASIYSTDVGAQTADKNRAQQSEQFQQNLAFNQQKQHFEQNKPLGFETGSDGYRYAIYPNGKGIRVLGEDGQPLKMQTTNSPAQTAQKEETQRLQRVDAVLPEIEKLLPKATNSYVGRGLDYLVRGFGGANQGDIATDQLKTLSGQLVSLMPKMSGPQSDKDVAMYKEMAGNLSDPTKSVEARMAALNTIRDLNEKYKELNQQNNPTVRPPMINTDSFMP
ncbi:hypothetical protein [Acinetobacter bereziniae]|uniref:hypothetical protein n=1 Tax=Acinetobacter bereziniae TaxID=106648 RepID=UPI003AF603F8